MAIESTTKGLSWGPLEPLGEALAGLLEARKTPDTSAELLLLVHVFICFMFVDRAKTQPMATKSASGGTSGNKC